jgi:hypothetical protein
MYEQIGRELETSYSIGYVSSNVGKEKPLPYHRSPAARRDPEGSSVPNWLRRP